MSMAHSWTFLRGTLVSLLALGLGRDVVAGPMPGEQAANHDATQGVKTPDRGARHPVGASSLGWVPQPKLWAADGATTAGFSAAVAMWGDAAIVGSRYDANAGLSSGSAYIFVNNGSLWMEETKVVPADAEDGQFFGCAVALSTDTALVGAFEDTEKAIGAGAVYVFVRNGSTWTQQAKLLAADGGFADHFGFSVAISGNTALIGAPEDAVNGPESGSVYVFVRNGSTWTQEAKLSAADAGPQRFFGTSVALHADTALVGAVLGDGLSSETGAAYVFVRNGGAWTQQQKLWASDGSANSFLGTSVALFGDTALVGAPGAETDGVRIGGAYLFARSGTTWTEQQKLLGEEGDDSMTFGISVALWGDNALVGAPSGSNMGVVSGVAFSFVRSGPKWVQSTKLVAFDGFGSDNFGAAVALWNDRALVGAPYADAQGSDVGAAYPFIASQFADSDGDTLSDEAEELYGSNPYDADSDDDGLLDGNEPSWNVDSDHDGSINAMDFDSDSDAMYDGTEMGRDCEKIWTDPINMHCIADADLGATVTDPIDADTDDDCKLDGLEDSNRNGQIDTGEGEPNKPEYSGPCCMTDIDCGTNKSGRICNQIPFCEDGCRGQGGNGCPVGKQCTSNTSAPGACVPEGGSGSGNGSGSGRDGMRQPPPRLPPKCYARPPSHAPKLRPR